MTASFLDHPTSGQLLAGTCTTSHPLFNTRRLTRPLVCAGFRVAVSTASPLLLPASLFTLQAGLNLYAATGLDAVTFQACGTRQTLSSSPKHLIASRVRRRPPALARACR